MLQNRTAYPITATNIYALAAITGQPLDVMTANIGWCATYSQFRYPRWMIVPESHAVFEMEFTVDRETYP